MRFCATINERVKPFVPGGRKGKRGSRSDGRRFFDALLWMAHLGARWRDLPVDRFGFYQTATLSDIDPPNGYRISGEGSLGVAGFVNGGATVKLEADGPDVTILHYDVGAQIGGKLAQLGVQLINSTAKKLTGEFFETFAEQVSERRRSNRTAGAAGLQNWPEHPP